MNVRPLVLAALVLSACDGGGGQNPLLSSDLRIDGAGQNPDGVDSETPRMCTAPNGDIYVVWADDRDGTSDVWLTSSKDKGRSWFAAVRVNQHTESTVWAPDVGCAADGVYVVWEDDRDSEIRNHNIYFQRSFDGGTTWDALDKRLDPDEEGRGMSYGPRIAVKGGNISVTWYDNIAGAFDIQVSSSGNAGDEFMQVPARVDSGSGPGAAYSASPRIVMTESRFVYIVWEDSRDGASDIYYARSSDGGFSFDPDQRIDLGDVPGSSDSFAPEIAADNDNVYIVWHDSRGGQFRDVYMNYSSNGGRNWLDAQPVEVSAAGFSEGLYPTVAVVGADAHIAWQDNDSGGYDILYRRAISGAFAAAPVRMNVGQDPGTTNALRPQAAAAGGQVVIAWEDRRDDVEQKAFNDLYYNFSNDSGATFGDPDLRIDSIEAGTAYKIDMSVSLFGGEIFTSWVDGREGTSDIYFHHLVVGEQAEYVSAPQ